MTFTVSTEWRCTDCLRPVQNAASRCCGTDEGWHHVSTVDMLDCPGTSVHIQAVAESDLDDPPEYEPGEDDPGWPQDEPAA